jgi:hypothetical protein
MAIFLAAPDAGRLLNVLVLNRPVLPADPIEPIFTGRALRIAVTVFWVAFIGSQLFTQISSGWTQYQKAYLHPVQSPIGGTYEVESFRAAGKEMPPLMTDDTRWRWVEIQPQGVVVRMTNEMLRRYHASFDTASATVTLTKDTLHWSRPDATHVMLEGTLDGAPVSALLRHVDVSSFPLNSRGYHWINEFPYNR